MTSWVGESTFVISAARVHTESRTAARALNAEEPIRQMYSQFQDLGPYEGHAVDSSTRSARVTAEQVCFIFRNFMIVD